MSKSHYVASLVLAFFLAFSLLPLAAAQASAAPSPEVADRLAQMEKQISELQAQIIALKQANAAVPSAPAGSLTVAPAASDATPSSKPLEGLTNVLGGATFTGYVDTYYNVDLNQPASHLSGARSWDNLNNGFALNMVNLVLDKAPDKDSRAGYHVSLGFGREMDVINGSEPVSIVHNRAGWDQYLLETYFSYLAPVGKGLQVDVGKFVTPIGAEVIPSKDNWNYTRSLLFDYAIPLYHYGVRAKYAFNDKVALTGFVLNGWNNVIDNNSGKTGAVSLALTPTKKLSITQNYMFGPEQNDTSVLLAGGASGSPTAGKHWRHLVDTTVSYSLSKKLSLMTNFDYGRDTLDGVANPVYWTGVAQYVRYAFNPKYSVATRYEYYNDHYGFTTGLPEHIQEVTGTFERRIAGHIISRLEYRRDISNRPVFFEHSFDTPTLKNQNTFTAGVVYTLDKTE